MSSQDRTLLALLAAGVALVWWGSLPKGLGMPSLEGGGGRRGKGDDGPQSAPKPRPSLPAASSSSGPGAGGPGAPGDGVIDVSAPRVVSIDQYKREKARAARAAAKRKPK